MVSDVVCDGMFDGMSNGTSDRKKRLSAQAGKDNELRGYRDAKSGACTFGSHEGLAWPFAEPIASCEESGGHATGEMFVVASGVMCHVMCDGMLRWLRKRPGNRMLP